MTVAPSVAIAETSPDITSSTSEQSDTSTELTSEAHEFDNPLDGNAYEPQSDDIRMQSMSDSQLS